MSIAVQALIVYGQARRVYDGVLASANEDDRQSAGEDLRSLATMLLTAGPGFFDDPQARQFLERAERLARSIYRAFTVTAAGHLNAETREHLEADMAQLSAVADPLVGRIPVAEWALADRPVQPEHGPESGDGQ